MKKLLQIQMELKAPKTQTNKFGGYKFRSCEDIMEAVKPILEKYNCIITLSDELVNIGERYYIKANASIIDLEGNPASDYVCVTTTGYAREEETKKGFDAMQLTGATSSYARKYALNGLLAIDDTKDSDTTSTHGKAVEKTDDDSVFKEDFGRGQFDLFTKWATDKEKDIIVKQVEKIKKDYNVDKEIQDKIGLYLNNVK